MKLICIGRNYTEHIKELENEKPTDPVVFLKPDTAILLKKQPLQEQEFHCYLLLHLEQILSLQNKN